MDNHECCEIDSTMTLDCINRILMEDGIDEKVSIYQELDALQATEKPFYDILGQPYSSRSKETVINRNSQGDCFNDRSSKYHDQACSGIISDPLERQDAHLITTNSTSELDHWVLQFRRYTEEAKKFVPNVEMLVVDSRRNGLSISKQMTKGTVGEKRSKHTNKTGNHPRDEGFELLAERNRKHHTISASETIRDETFDSVLLFNGKLYVEVALHKEMMAKEVNNNPRKFQSKGYIHGEEKSPGNKKHKEVDLSELLIQCAEALASGSHTFASEVLKKIMNHSSPYGNGSQRLAICFADGLWARLAGNGGQINQHFMTKQTSSRDMLKAYNIFKRACPFVEVAYYFSNKTIVDVLKGRPRVHIIDFGISFGFQWPSLFKYFATREDRPYKFRITGIDVPHPGFLPSEKIDVTGKRLAYYADMFHIPFHYRGIAKRWETICMEDLNIDRDEVLIVNCLSRMQNLGDEIEEMSSARDRVLHIMKGLNPDVLIIGVVNGLYSSPFFLPRFREVLFHYSTLFDMINTTVPCNHEGRTLIERDLFGRTALNVVACEGAERIERPESYKKWQLRILRAGFMQLPVSQAILESMEERKKYYHQNFFIDEDSGWLLQGWKGRITNALSSWKPKDTYTEH